MIFTIEYVSNSTFQYSLSRKELFTMTRGRNENSVDSTSNNSTEQKETDNMSTDTVQSDKSVVVAKSEETKRTSWKAAETTLYTDGVSTIALVSVPIRMTGNTALHAMLTYVNLRYFDGKATVKFDEKTAKLSVEFSPEQKARMTIVHKRGNIEIKLNDHVSHFLGIELGDIAQESNSYAVLGENQPSWITAAAAAAAVEDDLDALLG